ncbi:MAG: T9SS type A sorting domain-containing protein, partial [Lewinella sp.]
TSAGLVVINGEVRVEGGLENTGTLIAQGSGGITFYGNPTANFATGTNTLANLTNQKVGSDIVVTGELIVNNFLDLSGADNSRIRLGADNMVLGSDAVIVGANSDGYIETSGNGFLRKKVATSDAFTFPVGNEEGYTPLTLDYSGSSFSNAYLDVRVQSDPEPNLPPEVTAYTDRFWTVESAGIPDFQSDIFASFLNGDVVMDITSIEGASFANGEWIYTNGGRTDVTLTGTVDSPEFTFTGSNARQSALPVELLSFQAETTEGSHTELNWSTASEYETSHFLVERSRDAQNWEDIAMVRSDGNSTQQRDYLYFDRNVPSRIRQFGTVYYRLAIHDIDGYRAYSPIVAVDFSREDEGLTIFPNPTTDLLHISAPDSIRSVTVYTTLGEKMLTSRERTLSLKQLPAGLYRIRVETQSGWQPVQTVAVWRE